MNTEIPHWDFERIKREARESWNKESSKIEIQTTSKQELGNFYTAMYHAALMPSTYMDVNGEYKGLDQNVHRAT